MTRRDRRQSLYRSSFFGGVSVTLDDEGLERPQAVADAPRLAVATMVSCHYEGPDSAGALMDHASTCRNGFPAWCERCEMAKCLQPDGTVDREGLEWVRRFDAQRASTAHEGQARSVGIGEADPSNNQTPAEQSVSSVHPSLR